jgi:hypothetical protein
MNQQQSIDAKRRGGITAGRAAAQSGELAARGQRGASRVREIAEGGRDQRRSA